MSESLPEKESKSRMSERERDLWLHQYLPAKFSYALGLQMQGFDASCMIEEVRRQMREVREDWTITKAGDSNFGITDTWDD